MKRLATHPLAWSVAGGVLLATWSLLAIGGVTSAIDEVVITEVHELMQAMPRWTREWARDVTSLGSSPVLLMVMAVTGVWLGVARRWACLFTLVVVGMGMGMAAPELMKLAVDRTRPTVHDPTLYVFTASFPSGHAASSAAVYLTAALLIAASLGRRWQRRLVITVALVLSAMIGLSRVVLGLHWPSDVIGGWVLGMTWAWTLWWLTQWWQVRRAMPSRATPACVAALLLLLTGCYQCPPGVAQPDRWARPVTAVPLTDVYDMGDGILRGPMPKPSDYPHLQTLGVRTVLNLTRHHDDEPIVREYGMAHIRVPIDVWRVSHERLAEALAVLGDQSHRPIYMHCRLGIDRTGWVAAAYRVVYQGWTKDQALCEMQHEDWGFWLWQNLVHSIQRLDIERMRAELGVPSGGLPRSTSEAAPQSCPMQRPDQSEQALDRSPPP